MTTFLKQIAISRKTTLAGLLGLCMVLAGAPVTRAAGADHPAAPGKDHPTSQPAGKATASAPAGQDNDTKAGMPSSVPELWKAVQAGRVRLDQLVAGNKLGMVHEVAFWVRDLVAELPRHSKLAPESAVRLEDSSTRVAQIAAALDEAGDAGDKAAVKTQLTRLDGVLTLIEGLYPADQTPALEYVCPMHLKVRQAGAGKCPKCGMFLTPDAATMPEPDHQHGGHQKH